MDFFLNEKGDEDETQKPDDKPPKRDELMDALNAIDDDIASPHTTKNEDYQSEEEIVFDSGTSSPHSSSSATPANNTNSNVQIEQQQKQQPPQESPVENLQNDDLEVPEQDEDIDLDLEIDGIDDDDDDDELQDLEEFLKKGGK